MFNFESPTLIAIEERPMSAQGDCEDSDRPILPSFVIGLDVS